MKSPSERKESAIRVIPREIADPVPVRVATLGQPRHFLGGADQGAGHVLAFLVFGLGVTPVQRDVFLDDVIDEGDIMKELARTEAIAAKHGFAIAIGHPHPDTIAALKRWIPAAKARGFVLVPVSAVAKKQAGVTG